MHILWMKDFYKLTNIKKENKKEILNYYIESFGLIVKANLDKFFFCQDINLGKPKY